MRAPELRGLRRGLSHPRVAAPAAAAGQAPGGRGLAGHGAGGWGLLPQNLRGLGGPGVEAPPVHAHSRGATTRVGFAWDGDQGQQKSAGSAAP